jgi:hypothetical protein
MSIQDVNHLTISGHVHQPPQPDDDDSAGDAIASCQFVLTHTTHSASPGAQQQHYRVIVHDDVAEAFAAHYEPGQMVIVMGRLELEIHDTLIGPLPAISIIAHRIILVDRPTNQATTSTAAHREHTAIRLVP